MDDRILKGSSDWKKTEIVLNIPPNADRIVYGMRLWGHGEAWVNGMNWEVIGKDVAATDPAEHRRPLPAEPKNLP